MESFDSFSSSVRWKIWEFLVCKQPGYLSAKITYKVHFSTLDSPRRLKILLFKIFSFVKSKPQPLCWLFKSRCYKKLGSRNIKKKYQVYWQLYTSSCKIVWICHHSSSTLENWYESNYHDLRCNGQKSNLCIMQKLPTEKNQNLLILSSDVQFFPFHFNC